jgi:hypothetical protein
MPDPDHIDDTDDLNEGPECWALVWPTDIEPDDEAED